MVTEGLTSSFSCHPDVDGDFGFRGIGHQKDQLSINNMLPNMLCEDDVWYGKDDRIAQMLCDRSEQIEVEERQRKFDVFK